MKNVFFILFLIVNLYSDNENSKSKEWVGNYSFEDQIMLDEKNYRGHIQDLNISMCKNNICNVRFESYRTYGVKGDEDSEGANICLIEVDDKAMNLQILSSKEAVLKLATNDKSKKCSANIIKTDKGFKFTKPEINAKECANILIDYGCGEGTDPYWDGEFIRKDKWSLKN